MKKTVTFLSLILCAGLFASCSGSSSTEVDNKSKTDRLGVGWLYQNDTVKYTTKLNESAEGAHFTLTMPENPDDMVRTHFEPVAKKYVKNDSINVLYASQRASELSSLKDSIANIVEQKKETINNSITSFEAKVFTDWSTAIEIEAADDQGVLISYLPLQLNYYSDTDETSKGVLYTYVLVPVEVIVTGYSIDNDGKYVFTNTTATSRANAHSLVTWTSDKSGSIA